MNNLFWKNRRVLITGHSGFKGSWLSLWLGAMGAKVVGYSLAPETTPNLFDLANVESGMQSSLADIVDGRALSQAVADSGAEVVFHMAAQSLVRLSYENPVETYQTNVMGTVNLLEAVRSSPSVRAVVIVTSDKCYEPRDDGLAHKETDPMGGDDPYASSKGCAELVAASYRHSFFNEPNAARIATVRSGNVIGGGDWARDRLVPDILRAFDAGVPVSIRNPNAIRPWQHVIDPLSGYLMLAEHLLSDQGSQYATGWNFGPDGSSMRPVSDLVNILSRISNGKIRFEIDGGEHPHENPSLHLDSELSRRELGWSPRLDLEAALTWSFDWHTAFTVSRDGARDKTLEQLAAYQNLSQSA